MENKKLFAEYISMLSELFDKEVTPVSSKAYWSILDPYNDAQCKEAFDLAIKRCKFFPKPSELLEFISGPENDKATLAWLRVDKAVRTIGNYESVDFSDDRAINSTIEAMGGWVALCDASMDEWKWKRKEFENLYPTMTRRQDHPEYLPGTVEINNVGRMYEAPEVLRLTENQKQLRLVQPRRGLQESNGGKS